MKKYEMNISQNDSMANLSTMELIYVIRVMHLFLNHYGIGLEEDEIEWAFDNVKGIDKELYC